ncbi:MAG: ankyrin repeat domain-containing protein [Armatimonadota bacterium]
MHLRPWSDAILLWSAGHRQAGLARVALLFAEPNAQIGGRGCDTPLHRAARTGDVRLVSLLLASGADPNIRDYWGNTPLHTAAQAGHLDAVKKLVAGGASTYVRATYGVTPVYSAVIWRHQDVADWLSARSPKANIICAAGLGDIAAVTEALRMGADANTTDSQGISPLYWAVRRRDIAMAQLLLKSGARPSPRNIPPRIPYLILAVQNEDVPMLDILLSYGANPDERDAAWDSSALHLAAAQGYSPIVAKLLEHGADPDYRDFIGETPRDLAIRWGHSAVVSELDEALVKRSLSRSGQQ